MKQFAYALTLCALLWVTIAHAQTTDTQFLITEVVTQPAQGGTEWIELAYWGDTPLDISEYKLGDEESAGQREGMAQFPVGTIIEPGQIIIVAREAEPFIQLYGFAPDFEFVDSTTAVSDLLPAPDLASGSVELANSGDEILLLDAQNQLLDSLSYGTSTHFFDPAISTGGAGQSLARVYSACDQNTAVDWIPTNPTPGQLPPSTDCPPPLDLSGNTPLHIGDIQGAGSVAPAVNRTVTLSGTITGQHTDQNSRGTIYYTLFLQDGGDGDPTTSDGVPLFFGRNQPDLQAGDVVQVSGRLIEYYGLTELSDRGISWSKLDTAVLPDPIELTADHLQNLEALEGMRVTLPEAVVMGGTHAGCGFALTLPDQSGRLLRHTIDTDISAIVPVLFATDVDCTEWPQLKTGDVVRNLTGPLTYNFEQYKIVLQDPTALEIVPAEWPDLPPVPELAEGQISVASFNLFNHFDEVDDTGNDAEPKPTAVEIALKEQKIAHAVRDVLGCPTLLGIQEVENEALLLSLAQAIEPLCGFVYEVSHLESDDVRGIDVALLSDPRRAFVTAVSLQRACTTLDTGLPQGECSAGEQRLFSRPPLEVQLLIDNEPFVIYVNHFKSKLGGEEETTPRRIAQAEHLLGLSTAVLEANPDAHVIVMGDFNDYADSEPLQVLASQLENVLRRLPPEQQYSYVFSGVSQLIDGLWLTPHTADKVTEVMIQHVNADLPASVGQRTDPDLLPFGSSDHDLPLMVLNLAEATPTPEATVTATVTPAEVIAQASATPQMTPTPEPSHTPTAVPTPPPPPDPPTPPAPEPDNTLLSVGLVGLVLVAAGALAAFFLWRQRG